MEPLKSNDSMKKEQPNQNAKGIFSQVLEILGLSLVCDECGFSEEISLSNFIEPSESEYLVIDGEEPEVVNISLAKHKYIDPVTYEIYYFEKQGNYKKNNRYLRYEGEAKAVEYQGRKVTLNKPFRTPDGPKKFSVYVKNEKGNVVKVNFGDPNMEIKKDIPARRKSFRARMRCDTPGPKWKARYWACKSW